MSCHVGSKHGQNHQLATLWKPKAQSNPNQPNQPTGNHHKKKETHTAQPQIPHFSPFSMRFFGLQKPTKPNAGTLGCLKGGFHRFFVSTFLSFGIWLWVTNPWGPQLAGSFSPSTKPFLFLGYPVAAFHPRHLEPDGGTSPLPLPPSQISSFRDLNPTAPCLLEAHAGSSTRSATVSVVGVFFWLSNGFFLSFWGCCVVFFGGVFGLFGLF